MKRNKQTKMQRARNTGIVGVRRLSSGEWELVLAYTYGSIDTKYPIISMRRWCLPHSQAIRKHYLRSKR